MARGPDMSDNEPRRPAVVRTNAEPAPPPAPTDWTAVYEEQLSSGDKSEGGFLNNQFAKIGFGCVLPFLFLVTTCSSMTRQSYDAMDGATAMGYVAGGAIIGVLLCWAPLFVFWLRDQSKWIIGASFAAITMLFVLLGFAQIGNSRKALEEDAAAISNMQFDKDGNPILAPGLENKGPMTKLIVEQTQRQTEIRTAFEIDIKKSGIEDMMFADRVTRTPSLVQNCGRILELKPAIEGYKKRSLDVIQQTPDRIDELDLSYAMKREMKKGAMDKIAFNTDLIQKQWDLQTKSIDPVHRTCLILSKRNWKAQGALFAFTNQADMNGFNAAMEELDVYNAELEKLSKIHVDDLKASQDKIKQGIGR
jgi:hypothetical protein